jgi:hypothetical protein
MAEPPSILHDSAGIPRTESTYVAQRLAGEPRQGNPTNIHPAEYQGGNFSQVVQNEIPKIESPSLNAPSMLVSQSSIANVDVDYKGQYGGSSISQSKPSLGGGGSFAHGDSIDLFGSGTNLSKPSAMNSGGFGASAAEFGGLGGSK